MSQEIRFQPLAPVAAAPPAGRALSTLNAVPVDVSVEIGRTRMTIGQALDLTPGSIVSLNRLAGEPVDLLVNGKAVARGEVVVIDEEFGLRITEIVTPERVPTHPLPAQSPVAAAAGAPAGPQEPALVPDPPLVAGVEGLEHAPGAPPVGRPLGADSLAVPLDIPDIGPLD